MYTLGIDIGSTTSKCILLKDGKEIKGKSLILAGTGTEGPELALQQVLSDGKVKREDISYIMATGYGRTGFSEADGQMSELSAHGKGVYFTRPQVRTIIDIGGQDAKVIRLSEKGIISNFVMNDKCAAGTGRFLDVMAGVLKVDIGELEEYAARAETPAKISSTCTVFAESEVISQLSKGVELSDLIAGICSSVAARVSALAKRLSVEEEVFMSGGVAKNGGVRRALEKELSTKILVTDNAQYMGALGAALAAFGKARG